MVSNRAFLSHSIVLNNNVAPHVQYVHLYTNALMNYFMRASNIREQSNALSESGYFICYLYSYLITLHVRKT